MPGEISQTSVNAQMDWGGWGGGEGGVGGVNVWRGWGEGWRWEVLSQKVFIPAEVSQKVLMPGGGGVRGWRVGVLRQKVLMLGVHPAP